MNVKSFLTVPVLAFLVSGAFADGCNPNGSPTLASKIKFIQGSDPDNTIKFQLVGCTGGDGASGSVFYFPTGTSNTGAWLSMLESALTTGSPVKVHFAYNSSTGNWLVSHIFLYPQ